MFLRHMIPKMGIRDKVRAERIKVPFGHNLCDRIVLGICMRYLRRVRRYTQTAVLDATEAGKSLVID